MRKCNRSNSSYSAEHDQLSAALLVIQNAQYFLSFYGGFTAMKRVSRQAFPIPLIDGSQMYQLIQDKVLRAKMQFFSKTRAGSILQRLGPDLVSYFAQAKLKD